jgi:hypothetical protein
MERYSKPLVGVEMESMFTGRVETYISRVRSEGKDRLTEEIPYDADSFEAIGRLGSG